MPEQTMRLNSDVADPAFGWSLHSLPVNQQSLETLSGGRMDLDEVKDLSVFTEHIFVNWSCIRIKGEVSRE